MSDASHTLYLLDAMALAYRAHFIFINRPLINSKGFNSSATYGFTSALIKLIEDHSIEHIGVVFDVMEEGGTFRDELYEDYKGHRDPPPEELLANLPHIKQVVQALDIPVIEFGGVEADDVIGTLARKAEREGAYSIIVSPDKDFQQLVSEKITQYRPAYRGEQFDPITLESFREKYGLEPLQFIDILALMGDSADNVPGVHGIGEKTAIKLIQEYGSVEKLLEHADDIKGKRAREGLQSYRDDAILSKKLVTIKTDVETPLDWDDLHCRTPDLGRIRELFRELEFVTLYDRIVKVLGSRGVPDDGSVDALEIPEDGAPAESKIESEQGSLFEGDPNLTRFDEESVAYELIADMDQLAGVVDRFKDLDRFAMDTETTGKDPMLASLVGISLSANEGTGVYIPTPMPDNTRTEQIIDALRPVLESDAVKVGQNIKYDLLVLARHGVDVKGPVFDTMVAHYLVSPEDPHGMDYLARTFLSYETIPISELIGKGKEQRTMRDVPIKDVAPYACEDADITWRLAKKLEPQIEKNDLHRIAFDMEFPLVEALTRMEARGIRVDPDVLSELSERVETDLEKLQGDIFESAGEEFNINSPAQIGTILFEKLELPVVSKTSTGKPSTKESVLQELATEHDLPALILDWRELAKLKSTYIDALAGLIHPETGRIHTSYSQTTAATGRLSSNNPNLQNIPIRTVRGREIRKAFIAEKGFVLMSADYAQIELRILASLAGDDAMMQAFRDGEDIHTATAARVFKVDPSEVTRTQRNRAKEVNYGIPYGISAFGLSQRLRCPRSEAKDLIDTYNTTFPRVASFLVEQVEKAKENGYASTALGRRRYLPDLVARNHAVRSAAERVAVNMPIQGTQADMIKLAMVHIDRRLQESNSKTRMLLQVHDELVFEVPEESIDETRDLVVEEMTNALPLEIPIEVSVDTGSNWLEAH